MAPEESWRSGPGLVESVWAHKWLVVALTIVLAGAGYGLSSIQDPTYLANARLFLADPRSQTVLQAQSRLNDPERVIPQQVERIRSRTVLSDAAERLGGGLPPGQIRARLVVRGEPSRNLITLEASAGAAQRAADTANAVAEAYIDFAERQTLQRAQQAVAELRAASEDLRADIEDLRAELQRDPDDIVAESSLEVKLAQLNSNQTRIAQVTVDATVFGSGVELFEPAEARAEPVAPKPIQNGIVAGMLGAILAAALAYWRAGRSDTLRSRDDVADILGAPLLGEIPMFDSPDGTATIVSDPIIDEAYALAVASLEYELGAIGGRTVMITSASTEEGKTTTALRLGLAAAQGGRDVILVDADLRARGLSAWLGADDLAGITDLAHGRETVDACLHRYRLSPDTALPVVSAGTPMGDASRFLRSRAFMEATAELRERGDLVLFDSAPLLAVADTSILGGHVDAIVLVVREDTPASKLRQLRERLAFTTARLVGYVYITSKPRAGEAYVYAYGHTAAEEATETPLSEVGEPRPERDGDRGDDELPSDRDEAGDELLSDRDEVGDEFASDRDEAGDEFASDRDEDVGDDGPELGPDVPRRSPSSGQEEPRRSSLARGVDKLTPIPRPRGADTDAGEGERRS